MQNFTRNFQARVCVWTPLAAENVEYSQEQDTYVKCKQEVKEEKTRRQINDSFLVVCFVWLAQWKEIYML